MTQNTENPTAYEFGGFRLDRTVLEFRGVVVPLTPKAVDTLYLLVSRAPAVVGKDEIMRTVWPDTFVVESSLARNISVIRKALEDCSGSGPYIETIPKRGYRFVASVNQGGQNLQPAVQSEVPDGNPGPRRRFWLFPAAAFLLIVTGGALLYHGAAAPPSEPDPSTLIGWHLFHKVTPAEMQQALTAFEKAVAVDPNSAIAHAGLAATLLTLPRLAGGAADSLARGKLESETAVRLDPLLGAAHASRGTAQMVVDWDFSGAEKSFRRALELDPRSILALVYYAQLLCATAQFDEALAVAQRAASLDPVSPMIGVQVGIALYVQRRFDDAARQFQSVLDRERSFTLSHYYLGLTYGYLGKFEEARAHLAKADLHPHTLRTDRAWLALREGDRDPAEKLYERVKSEVRSGSMNSSALILPAASLGLLDEAFAALETALRERNPDMLNLRSDPRLEPLRADRRYQDVIRRFQPSPLEASRN